MNHSFFAAISRMKYIDRWALMRNSRPENLSEHSMEVAMIAHALCLIGNVRYGRNLNGDHAAVLGLYHDAPEIITGDLPTPVKYGNTQLKDAYRDVEQAASLRLLSGLPDDLRPAFEEVLNIRRTPEDADEAYLRQLVKAADRISALIKCIEEERSGNMEFVTARSQTQKRIDELCDACPEVRDFIRDFLPPYGNTLDQLLG